MELLEPTPDTKDKMINSLLDQIARSAAQMASERAQAVAAIETLQDQIKQLNTNPKD